MRILVSGIGGDIAQSIVKILRDTTANIEIVGTDAKELSPVPQEIEKFTRCPMAKDASQYLDWLQELLQNEKFDFFIPVNEDEIKFLVELSDSQLNSIQSKTKIIWAGKRIVSRLQSKYGTYKFLLELGQNPPKTLIYDNSAKIENFPVIVKPNFGRGSKNIFFCESQAEVHASALFTKDPIVQEFIPSEDTEYTCGVYKKEKTIKIIILRRYLSGGLTSWAEVVADEEIYRTCYQVAEMLELDGSINIQLRKNVSRVAIFEINPRFSSTILMRHKVGFQDLLWCLGFSAASDFNFQESIGKKITLIRDVRVS